MRIAFKAWAVVMDALGHGEQIIILRKGGLREARGGFELAHYFSLLFPTLFHQQRESVRPVLSRAAYADKLEEFCDALDLEPAS